MNRPAIIDTRTNPMATRKNAATLAYAINMSLPSGAEALKRNRHEGASRVTGGPRSRTTGVARTDS
jgi:hypothetical protein